ncbi:hypothetical protein IWQ62_003599, partial [Dispira parvispora]
MEPESAQYSIPKFPRCVPAYFTHWADTQPVNGHVLATVAIDPTDIYPLGRCRGTNLGDVLWVYVV